MKLIMKNLLIALEFWNLNYDKYNVYLCYKTYTIGMHFKRIKKGQLSTNPT